mgnify:FL=1
MMNQDIDLNASVVAEESPANMMDSLPYGNADGNLFLWITVTMLWVIMILAIMSLVKYLTHEHQVVSAPSSRRRK